jgi:hypothetical protein
LIPVHAASATRTIPLPTNLTAWAAAAGIGGVDRTANRNGTSPASLIRLAASLACPPSQDRTPALPVASTLRWNPVMTHLIAERGTTMALSNARRAASRMTSRTANLAAAAKPTSSAQLRLVKVWLRPAARPDAT